MQALKHIHNEISQGCDLARDVKRFLECWSSQAGLYRPKNRQNRWTRKKNKGSANARRSISVPAHPIPDCELWRSETVEVEFLLSTRAVVHRFLPIFYLGATLCIIFSLSSHLKGGSRVGEKNRRFQAGCKMNCCINSIFRYPLGWFWINDHDQLNLRSSWTLVNWTLSKEWAMSYLRWLDARRKELSHVNKIFNPAVTAIATRRKDRGILRGIVSGAELHSYQFLNFPLEFFSSPLIHLILCVTMYV